MKEFDAGTLANGRTFGDENYYFLVAGEDVKGQTFSFVTRGKGKQNAATRIPIRIRISDYDKRQKFQQLRRGPNVYKNDSKDPNAEFMALIQLMADAGCWIDDLKLLYVVMPRYGNIVSGLEADAPGGTANLGETRVQVADREFDEEADLSVLAVYQPFPSWLQFSSGSYDEVQNISFALVEGKPTKLVEGAIEWGSVSLSEFDRWVKDRNDPSQYLSDTTKFVPMDGKVVLATMWLKNSLSGILW
ncbi:MAG: hypothetical protein A3C02_02245 [Candidatus Andersenbacteria bacterium RIFCSPHIGHO2_02_FULL_45_11]|uniref:Nudix hydrolase domain-containing protein n=1 Tax=Candidatus Andersenbacteria bacterium RIFCSPHIGHO2_12_FULL_45_11 TaxID=1797281 RepID=A0A1G1X1T4_9BACT|nr:MAG: hypothetical protein A2805_02700 [Candidatus Andersenbacteria bacterium RIFCSPHIGHO2_01_FULL_46_36]OGY32548.1 MAG: hypothetical protein A3C02_02245 [Candidatus Andersenbacteria bacterium RIFCSPHIGHO2_02_FULL_45_11]OGY33933.1 MAG: hypothetical protein A3D99_01730 [Candidatus Andersenbacteria bacterium RIFCSPHIGHO2_12_FULL_45_11]